MKQRDKSNVVFVVVFSFGIVIVLGALLHFTLTAGGKNIISLRPSSISVSCNTSHDSPATRNEIDALKIQLVENSKKVMALEQALATANANKDVYSQESQMVVTSTSEERGRMLNEIEATFKSCLDPTCLQATSKQEDGKELQRIGLLAPDPFLNLQPLLVKLQDYPSKDGPKVFAFSSHVPPYGYGKNHGWTKIIRLVESIPHQAYRLLKKHQTGHEKEWDLMIETQVRQLARWHCRLNHVAAHTSMLTVFVDELITRPQFTLQIILSYAGFKPNKAELDNMVQSIIPNLKAYWRPFNEPIPKTFIDTIESALGDELSMSQNLQKWPCGNFMELEKKIILPSIRYFHLSANCSDPHTKCSVGFDKREQIVVSRK